MNITHRYGAQKRSIERYTVQSSDSLFKAIRRLERFCLASMDHTDSVSAGGLKLAMDGLERLYAQQQEITAQLQSTLDFARASLQIPEEADDASSKPAPH